MALKLAVDARRAAESGDPARVRQAAGRCRAALDAELEPHFQCEERDLLPWLETAGLSSLAARMRNDHAALRQRAVALPDSGVEALLDFAELLAVHVRFEEREMFPAFECLLEPDRP